MRIKLLWSMSAASEVAAGSCAVIRVDAVWMAVEPLDMRAGTEATLAPVVAFFCAAKPHHEYHFANCRANRMKVFVHDGKVPGGPATSRVIDYSLNRWAAPMRFIDDGKVSTETGSRARSGRSRWGRQTSSLRLDKRPAAIMT